MAIRAASPYLGMGVDMGRGIQFIPDRRKAVLMDQLKKWVRHRESISTISRIPLILLSPKFCYSLGTKRPADHAARVEAVPFNHKDEKQPGFHDRKSADCYEEGTRGT